MEGRLWRTRLRVGNGAVMSDQSLRPPIFGIERYMMRCAEIMFPLHISTSSNDKPSWSFSSGSSGRVGADSSFLSLITLVQCETMFPSVFVDDV